MGLKLWVLLGVYQRQVVPFENLSDYEAYVLKIVGCMVVLELFWELAELFLLYDKVL